MKALVLQHHSKFALEDVPTPEVHPDEVLIAVKACGICGSDVHGMDGSTGRRRPPIIMGHEAAGMIAALGRDVSGWVVGDRVTFDSTIYCGECEYCRQGQVNLCEHRRVLGVSCEEYRQHGAFAEFVAIPQRILYRLPEHLPWEQAALVEPFSIAMHAVGRASPKPGETAVVIGAGMIGLAVMQVLRAFGCQKIIAVDLAPDRLDLAMKCGAHDVINSAKGDAGEKVLELTHQLGADVSVEAVGVTAAVNLAMCSVRKGGKVVLVGNVAPKIEFPLQIAVTRELTVFGSCSSRGEYPACLELLAKKQLNPAPLISAVAPLGEGARWFERLYQKEPGLLKVVLQP